MNPERQIRRRPRVENRYYLAVLCFWAHFPGSKKQRSSAYETWYFIEAINAKTALKMCNTLGRISCDVEMTFESGQHGYMQFLGVRQLLEIDYPFDSEWDKIHHFEHRNLTRLQAKKLVRNRRDLRVFECERAGRDGYMRKIMRSTEGEAYRRKRALNRSTAKGKR